MVTSARWLWVPTLEHGNQKTDPEVTLICTYDKLFYLEKNTMHNHNFEESEWPFDFPINQMAITTRYVMDGSHPVTVVLHDEENDWQILCGTTNNPNDGMVVCMGCLYSRFPFLAQFRDLEQGWEAYRENEKSEWKLSQIEWDGE